MIKKTLDWYCLDLKRFVVFECDGGASTYTMVGLHNSV